MDPKNESYVDPKNESEYHKLYFKLVDGLIAALPNICVLAIVMQVSQRILEGDHYQALKECKKLFQFEAEVLAIVTE